MPMPRSARSRIGSIDAEQIFGWMLRGRARDAGAQLVVPIDNSPLGVITG